MVNFIFILGVKPVFTNIAIAALPAIYWNYKAYFITNPSSTIIYIFNTGYINYIIGNSRIFTHKELLLKLIYINGFSKGKSAIYIGLINLLY